MQWRGHPLSTCWNDRRTVVGREWWVVALIWFSTSLSKHFIIMSKGNGAVVAQASYSLLFRHRDNGALEARGDYCSGQQQVKDVRTYLSQLIGTCSDHRSWYAIRDISVSLWEPLVAIWWNRSQSVLNIPEGQTLPLLTKQ